MVGFSMGLEQHNKYLHLFLNRLVLYFCFYGL